MRYMAFHNTLSIILLFLVSFLFVINIFSLPQGKFMRYMAHEIRNPTSIVSSGIDILSDKLQLQYDQVDYCVVHGYMFKMVICGEGTGG